MIQILITALFLAISAAASGLESITIIGTPDVHAVHSVYMSLGGSFNLSSSGIKEFKNAHVSHLILDGNMTLVNSIFPALSIVPSHNSRRQTIVGITCDNGAYGSQHFFSQAQEQFIAGVACNALGAITPGIAATFGVIISNAICNQNNICTIVVAIVCAHAGDTIKEPFLGKCFESLQAVKAECGVGGGVATVETGVVEGESTIAAGIITSYENAQNAFSSCLTSSTKPVCQSLNCGSSECRTV